MPLLLLLLLVANVGKSTIVNRLAVVGDQAVHDEPV